MAPLDLTLPGLRTRYAAGETPTDVVPQVLENARAMPETFLSVIELQTVLDSCSLIALIPEAKRGPLWGTFFAVKDNIDVAGLPTTAGCPAYSHVPKGGSAPTVQALLDAGCICVGKVNMDQFAAGLNGTRTPSGTPKNVRDPRVIPGGSSSGSGAAVAAGAVTFALGTDTAGSGRVPAGLQGLVGVKPSVGLVSTTGVVPACASLDCVSVFARTVSEGALVATVMADAADYLADPTIVFPSTLKPDLWADATAELPLEAFKFAVPADSLMTFAGPRGEPYATHCTAAFSSCHQRLEKIGGAAVDLDFVPLTNAALMLYGSSFIAERAAGIAPFLRREGEGGKRPREWAAGAAEDERLLPVTRAIMAAAANFTATDVYEDLARLRAMRADAFAHIKAAAADVLVVPTVMHHYLISEIEKQETETPKTATYNAYLGTFTNFVNLLGMCACSVPAGRLPDIPLEGDSEMLKLLFGVTIIGKGGEDDKVWRIARRFEAALQAEAAK